MIRGPLDNAGARIVVLVDAVAEAHEFPVPSLDPVNVSPNVILRTDCIEHFQDFFVGASMQRTGKRGGGCGGPDEWIGLGAAHSAHNIGAAILFVVHVQDEENVQRTRQNRVRPVFRLDHPPQHVHEVFGVAKIIVGINVAIAETVPVGVGRDGRYLADQPVNLQLSHFRITHIAGVRVNGRKSRHRADEHAHGVGVVMETFQEPLGGFMQHGVMGDVGDEVFQLRFGW